LWPPAIPSGASSWGGGEAILHLSPSLALTNGTSNYWTPTNWSTLDGQGPRHWRLGSVAGDVPGATPSNLVVALGKDGNAYLLNRTNLGGISLPLAQAHVAGSSIIQAAATYQTTKGTYVVFANANNLYALRIGASNPPTITNVWTAAENGKARPSSLQPTARTMSWSGASAPRTTSGSTASMATPARMFSPAAARTS
jgi:hypothetical protein